MKWHPTDEFRHLFHKISQVGNMQGALYKSRSKQKDTNIGFGEKQMELIRRKCRFICFFRFFFFRFLFFFFQYLQIFITYISIMLFVFHKCAATVLYHVGYSTHYMLSLIYILICNLYSFLFQFFFHWYKTSPIEAK